MKEILETVIRNLVSEPESISINEVQGEQSVVFEIRVAEKDMGKVMGGLKAKYAGQMDFGKVNGLVKTLLGGN